MRLLRYTVVLGCIAALAGVCSLAQGGEIAVYFQFEPEVVDRQFPETLLVFRAYPDPVAQEQYDILLDAWGESTSVDFADASGGIFGGDMSRLWAISPGLEDHGFLDREVVRDIALSFLEWIGLPEEDFALYVTADSMEIQMEGGETRDVPLGYNVTLRQKLDGYEVVGPGGKLKIFLDLYGEPAGYLRVWRGAELVSEEPRVSVSEAAEMLIEDPLGPTKLAHVEEVRVVAVEIAYYQRGMFGPQEFIQPVFVFDCFARVEGMDEETYFARYIPALWQLYEPLRAEGEVFDAGERIEAPPRGVPTPGQDTE